jgi:hypothetical protein
MPTSGLGVLSLMFSVLIVSQDAPKVLHIVYFFNYQTLNVHNKPPPDVSTSAFE